MSQISPACLELIFRKFICPIVSSSSSPLRWRMFCPRCSPSPLKAAGPGTAWVLTLMTFSTSLSQTCNTVTGKV